MFAGNVKVKCKLMFQLLIITFRHVSVRTKKILRMLKKQHKLNQKFFIHYEISLVS